MRKLVLILSLLVPLLTARPLLAAQGIHIDASKNNIASAYSTSFPQAALTLLSPNVEHLYVANGASSPIVLTFTNYSVASAPASDLTNNPLQIFVQGSSQTQLNFLGAGKYIWLRNDLKTANAVLNSGDIIIDAW